MKPTSSPCFTLIDMATLRPFRGLHYNPKLISNLSDVIIPPYDTIPAGDDEKYWSRSPYNFAHVLLPAQADEDYTRSRDLLTKWREHQILLVDNSPGYYLYRQTFTLDGVKHARNLLLGCVALQEFADHVIRPHENTFGNPKKDRLQILRSTQCNLSHVFGMVQDPEGFLHSLYERWEYKAPLLHGTTDEGVEHSVWKIDSGAAKDVETFFTDKALYIVDGHHRYESALNYAREKQVLGQPDQAAASMLFAIANSYDPALVVLPTHRKVKLAGGKPSLEKIEKAFNLSPLSPTELKVYTSKSHKSPDFGLYIDGDLYRCSPKVSTFENALQSLAVYWSDEKLMKEILGVTSEARGERVSYEKDALKLWNERSDAEILIFHAPPAIDQIMDVADAKMFMPQKSTYFYPKLASGLILRDLRC